MVLAGNSWVLHSSAAVEESVDDHLRAARYGTLEVVFTRDLKIQVPAPASVIARPCRWMLPSGCGAFS